MPDLGRGCTVGGKASGFACHQRRRLCHGLSKLLHQRWVPETPCWEESVPTRFSLHTHAKDPLPHFPLIPILQQSCAYFTCLLLDYQHSQFLQSPRCTDRTIRNLIENNRHSRLLLTANSLTATFQGRPDPKSMVIALPVIPIWSGMSYIVSVLVPASNMKQSLWHPRPVPPKMNILSPCTAAVWPHLAVGRRPRALQVS